jgi:hypothetical protein
VTQIRFISENDTEIAIVTIEALTNLTDSQETISIPSTNETAITGFVVGFGDSDDGMNSKISQATVSITQCSSANHSNSTSQFICFEASEATCGIGEFLYEVSQNGSWSLLGIATNPNCSLDEKVSAFARVGFFSEKIKNYAS